MELKSPSVTEPEHLLIVAWSAFHLLVLRIMPILLLHSFEKHAGGDKGAAGIATTYTILLLPCLFLAFRFVAET